MVEQDYSGDEDWENVKAFDDRNLKFTAKRNNIASACANKSLNFKK